MLVLGMRRRRVESDYSNDCCCHFAVICSNVYVLSTLLYSAGASLSNACWLRNYWFRSGRTVNIDYCLGTCSDDSKNARCMHLYNFFSL